MHSRYIVTEVDELTSLLKAYSREVTEAVAASTPAIFSVLHTYVPSLADV